MTLDHNGMVQVKVKIPAELKLKVDLLLYDPVRAKAEYGRWQPLVIELLERWVEGWQSRKETK